MYLPHEPTKQPGKRFSPHLHLSTLPTYPPITLHPPSLSKNFQERTLQPQHPFSYPNFLNFNSLTKLVIRSLQITTQLHQPPTLYPTPTIIMDANTFGGGAPRACYTCKFDTSTCSSTLPVAHCLLLPTFEREPFRITRQPCDRGMRSFSYRCPSYQSPWAFVFLQLLGHLTLRRLRYERIAQTPWAS